ncbi:class I SAM-dependent methyltransferase [Paenibacillus chitinolyticus]|uniref:class I SAM-dependent methyltransferase n=1 Tax=Paenibacillus chitinolyticus TaxID=79263 RepID=UPI003CFFAAA5
MNEQIGNVILNYEFYDDTNTYSDGPIEDELLEIVKQNEVEKVLKEDSRWPVLYHLSPARENLLEWFPIEESANILEIGAGCGALTGLMCKKAEKVVAVELSKKRAQINAYRNKNQANLELVVGNLNDIQFKEKFDYITLIGVLEYAARFTKHDHPYEFFLKQIKALLKPNGKLIIAIENRLGLKYWAGANEDHTNELFDSLHNYPEDKEVRTFSKKELTDLISVAGFTESTFYYPYPDYKLPTYIFSDAYRPDPSVFFEYTPNYDSERFVLFNEKKVSEGLVSSGLAEEFSNSFLVICRN